MTTIMVDIPNEIKENIWLESHVNITDLFKKFWIDLEFVLKERKYSKQFLIDIEKQDFSIDNKF